MGWRLLPVIATEVAERSLQNRNVFRKLNLNSVLRTPVSKICGMAIQFAAYCVHVEGTHRSKYHRHIPSRLLFPEGGVGLVPKRGYLLTLAYYAFPRWYEFGERRWNDIDRGKPKNAEKNLSQCHSVHHKSHMYWPRREPGPPRWQAGD
jgi:hypothetical protein